MNWYQLNCKWENKIRSILVDPTDYCIVVMRDGSVFKGHDPEDIERKLHKKYCKLDQIKKTAKRIANHIDKRFKKDNNF